jgi:hypothetical protein
MSSRNYLLAGLAVVVAVVLVVILDPTVGGLFGRRYEGFESLPVVKTSGPSSSVGENPNMFPTPGVIDEARNYNATQNVTPYGTTVSPDTPKVAFGNAPNFGAGNNAEGFEDSPSPVPIAAASTPSNCYPKNQLAPQELLPNDPNSKWAQVNPLGQGDIAGKNFLNAGALIGVNTVGQSLRNASWDLRSEPPNPQVTVSPFNNSTIEPDVNRRVLEIA